MWYRVCHSCMDAVNYLHAADCKVANSKRRAIVNGRLFAAYNKQHAVELQMKHQRDDHREDIALKVCPCVQKAEPKPEKA